MLEWIQQLPKWAPVISAVTGLGVLVVACIAAGVAWFSLKETKVANIAARMAEVRASDQLKADSIRQTRPYVFAELVPSVAGEATYDMVIRNMGRSMARNLVAHFEPLPKVQDDIASKVIEDLGCERDLPPGAGIRTYWQIGAPKGKFLEDAEGKTTNNPAGLPEAGTIHLSYSGDDTQSKYRETYRFDAEAAGLWPIPESGITDSGLNGKERAFRSTLAALARHIGMLRW